MKHASAVRQSPKLSALILLSGFAASPAFAHKGLESHTHCTLSGKGIAVTGRTDAERKLDCGRVSGAAWDETVAVAIDEAATSSAKSRPADPGASGK